MFESFSLYQIEDEAKIPFSAIDYSKFKFGDGAVAEQFGRNLAAAFTKKHSDVLSADQPLVLVPSPFDSIPTASNALTRAFKKYLNYELYARGKNGLLESKIHRYKTYPEDYGNLSQEERIKLISGDTYHLDDDFLRDRTILLIDDIKITGSHEMVVKQMIEKHQLTGRFIFLYFAELTNKKIPASFENHLNYYFVKGLNDLTQIVAADSFAFNTRIIKYLLKSERFEFEDFLSRLGNGKLKEMVELSISNNYHRIDAYKQNLNYLIKHINYGN
jgi:hypothetical protein